MTIQATFEVPYPFVRETVPLPCFDDPVPADIVSWRPGSRAELIDSGATDWVADGWGHMLLRGVSSHKPGGRYPERVFYVRQWRDPDGLVFGKTNLRVTTLQAFKRLLKGHRYANTITSP